QLKRIAQPEGLLRCEISVLSLSALGHSRRSRSDLPIVYVRITSQSGHRFSLLGWKVLIDAFSEDCAIRGYGQSRTALPEYFQMSTPSAMARASSTSIPRYLTVLSDLGVAE